MESNNVNPKYYEENRQNNCQPVKTRPSIPPLSSDNFSSLIVSTTSEIDNDKVPDNKPEDHFKPGSSAESSSFLVWDLDATGLFLLRFPLLAAAVVAVGCHCDVMEVMCMWRCLDIVDEEQGSTCVWARSTSHAVITD